MALASLKKQLQRVYLYYGAMRERNNRAEWQFEQFAAQQGWRTTKRGWPDFLCRKPDGTIIAVEVKPRVQDGHRFIWLKSEQVAAMQFLEANGIECYVSDGIIVERFKVGLHYRQRRRIGAPRPQSQSG